MRGLENSVSIDSQTYEKCQLQFVFKCLCIELSQFCDTVICTCDGELLLPFCQSIHPDCGKGKVLERTYMVMFAEAECPLLTEIPKKKAFLKP